MTSKIPASFIDNNGKLFVDCSECAKTLCTQAWRNQPFQGGCYHGILHHRICKTTLHNLTKPIKRVDNELV